VLKLVFDVLSKIKRRKGKTIKLCPICLSPKLKPASSISGWLIHESYKCLNCGYEGVIYIEVSLEEAEKILNELKKQKEKLENQ